MTCGGGDSGRLDPDAQESEPLLRRRSGRVAESGPRDSERAWDSRWDAASTGANRTGGQSVAPRVPRQGLAAIDAPQAERSASVGDTRAALIAGYKPAITPMATAAANPPIKATGGMITRHPWASEYP